MLGKLIKYDMKAFNKFLIIIHGFLLLSAVLVRVFLTSRITMTHSEDGTLLGFAVILYTLIITGVSYGTLIIIAIRFYKNLFSDEGYLTYTLPVTGGQHLLSKTISGGIWALMDSLLVFVSMYIVAVTPEVKNYFIENKDVLLIEMGLTTDTLKSAVQTLGFSLIIIAVISALVNVIMIYASVALGQLFSGHRVLGSVVAYFALTTVISVIMFALISLTGLSAYATEPVSAGISFMDSMTKILWTSTGLSAIAAVILYVMTHYIMNKKVNLI